MRLGTLAAFVAVLDVLLGVVPRTTGVGEIVRHELTREDHRRKERAECLVADSESDDHWAQHRQERRGSQLAQRGRSADIDNRCVVGLTTPGHDLAIGELLTHLLDNHPSRATHGSDREGREVEGDRATNEQTDKRLHVGDVDLRGDVSEKFRTLFVEVELGADCFDVTGEQRNRCNDRGADGKSLGHGLRRVTDSVEADHDPLGLAVELARHLSDAGSVVRYRTERILRHDHASRGEHAHATQGDQIQRELQVAAAQREGSPQRKRDRQDGIDRRFQTRGSAREHHGGRARSSRLSDLPHRLVVRGGEVLRQAADDLSQNQTHDHGQEHLQTLMATTRALVAHIAEGHSSGTQHGQDARDQESAVDRLQRVRLALTRSHRKDACDRRDHTNCASGQRENHAQRRIGADRVKRRDSKDDRRNERDFVGLEEVGGHPGAVANVVADVVSDRRGVTRVVLGNSGLDLAHQVGADVGRLGKDAAANPQEQREKRTTESEADQDRRTRVLKRHDDRRRAEQSEADGKHAGDSAGAKRNLKRRWHRPRTRGGRGTDVASRGERHPDVAREAGSETAEQERERPEDSRLDKRQRDAPVGLCDLSRCDKHDDRERHQNDGDRSKLSFQIRPSTLLNRLRDFDHFGRALVHRQDVSCEAQTYDNGENSCGGREAQNCPLASLQREVLPAALSGEQADHAN